MQLISILRKWRITACTVLENGCHDFLGADALNEGIILCPLGVAPDFFVLVARA